MCRLIEAIDEVGVAADNLTRACTRRGALVDSANSENLAVASLRKAYRAVSLTPNDMLATLGRAK
jgi:hypothetical protein